MHAMDASPIIPWMGGKRRLADRLIPLFPAHECYVELFAGGAALFFLRPMPARCEVLNDLNGDLVNLYRVVQHHHGKVDVQSTVGEGTAVRIELPATSPEASRLAEAGADPR